jgi:integrin-linked kinase
LITALQRRPEDINQKAADMWSFAVLLWEMETREVPHAELSPMETGMKVRYTIVLHGRFVLFV